MAEHTFADQKLQQQTAARRQQQAFFGGSQTTSSGTSFIQPKLNTNPTAGNAVQHAGPVPQIQKQAQPPNSQPPILLEINPYINDPAAERREAELRRQLMEQLRRETSADELRALIDNATVALNQDDDFIAWLLQLDRPALAFDLYMRQMLRGFGRIMEAELIRQLVAAVNSNHAANAQRLLRILLPQFDDAPWVNMRVLRHCIDRVFINNPLHDDMVQSIDQATGRNQQLIGAYRHQQVTDTVNEVHFERPAGGGAYALEEQHTDYRYNWYISGNELRVVVVMRLVDANNIAQPYYIRPNTLQAWIDGIEQVWNNRFSITNGVNTYRLAFAPAFVYNASHVHHVIQIQHGTTTPTCNQLGRANSSCFQPTMSAIVAAHEFGHLIGNSDEYRMPARISNIPSAMQQNMTRGELEATTAEGVPGAVADPDIGFVTHTIMGNNRPVALPRHVQRVVDHFNISIINDRSQPLYWPQLQ